MKRDCDIIKYSLGWVLKTKYPSSVPLLVTIYPGIIRALRECKCLSVQVCEGIAQLTQTKIEYWWRLQNIYFLKFYLRRRKPNPVIEKIERPELIRKIKQSNNIGNIIWESLDEANIKFPELSMQLALWKRTMCFEIIEGKVRISYHLATKLASLTTTSIRYWNDLQTKEDVSNYMNVRNISFHSYPGLQKYFEINLSSKLSQVEDNSIHPGIYLYDTYLKPSVFKMNDWADFFCLDMETLKKIIKGNRPFHPELFFLVSKVFPKPPEFWIHLQNTYYSNIYSKPVYGKIKIPEIKVSKRVRFSKVGETLIKKFLEPINLSTFNFAEHIKISHVDLIDIIRGKLLLPFEIAIRFGECTGTSTMFWLNLQMEDDVFKKRSRCSPFTLRPRKEVFRSN